MYAKDFDNIDILKQKICKAVATLSEEMVVFAYKKFRQELKIVIYELPLLLILD